MVTDVEGSTRLVLALGAAFTEVLETHNRLLRAAVDASGGVVVSTAGDGVFAVFRAAIDALTAAIAMQRALRDQAWPGEVHLRVRIGIHSGEGVLGGDDYLGLDVHRAARISAVAVGGQVLLSADTVADLAADVPTGVTLKDLGEHLLKDLPRPERLAQVVVADLPADFPPLASLRRPVAPPPRALTSFVGRPEVDQALALLASSRLLTITGPGGVGKTRIALAVAERVAEGYPDGVAFVDLAPVTNADLVAPVVAAAVGVPPGEGQIMGRLVSHLQGRRLMLVLDNFEQVLDAAPTVVEVLTAMPAGRVLVTSRAPLRVAGEQELPLSPLVPPSPGDEADVARLLATPAVALFVDRARAVRPDFALTPDNAHDVAGVVRSLDGLPLAVELAAARVRLLPPSEIVTALRRRGLSSLGSGRRDAPERQRTLESVVDWSYRLLDPSVAATFRALAVFAGGASLSHLEDVVGPGDTDVLEALGTLVEHSLVRQDEAVSQVRFTMLDTIRQFARQRLEEAGEAHAAARQHALTFLRLAQSAQPQLGGWEQTRWMDALERERDNLRAALGWGIEHDPRLGVELGLTLSHYWQVRGNRREGAYWLRRVAAAAQTSPEVSGSVVGDVRRRLAVLLDLAGECQEASEVLAAQLTEERGHDDPRRLASTLNSLGVTRRNLGDAEGARDAFEEAATLRREVGDEPGLASTLTNLAVMAMDDHDADRAEQLLRQVLVLDERLGNPDGLALDHANLGWVHLQRGDSAAAASEFSHAFAVGETVHDDACTAYVLEGCAVLAARAGDPGGAASLLGAGRRLRERADEPMPDADRRTLMEMLTPARDALGDAWEQEVQAGQQELDATTVARARLALGG
jgi:predicted ATPase/class 3 adenylate cyclase